MYVNIPVVQALASLRGLDPRTLARMAHVTHAAMQRWVSRGESDEVSFEQQLEVLNFLGVRGEAPRGDVVHFWHVHQPLFSRSAQTYEPLRVLAEAFGPAEVVFLSRETDPAFDLSAQSYFGLRFKDFVAILHVTAHPLRNIGFTPESIQGYSWASDTPEVLVPSLAYDSLEPGAMPVKAMNNYLSYTSEVRGWEALRANAQEKGLGVDQVSALLQGTVSNQGGLALVKANPAYAGDAVHEASVNTRAAHPTQPEYTDSSAEPVPASPGDIDNNRLRARRAFASVPRPRRTA